MLGIPATGSNLPATQKRPNGNAPSNSFPARVLGNWCWCWEPNGNGWESKFWWFPARLLGTNRAMGNLARRRRDKKKGEFRGKNKRFPLKKGTAGDQHSDGSQQGCWEIDAGAGNQLGTETGVENPVVPSKVAGNQMGPNWEPTGNF